MPSFDQKKPAEQKVDQTLVQKVGALQERVRKMGAVSGGSDNKVFMDEAWGDTEG